jgi:hypothetical protein
LVGSQVALV